MFKSIAQVHGFVQDNRTGQKVAMLIGKWDEAMYYVLGDPSVKPKGYDPMSEAVLLWERDKSLNQTRYNLSPFAISLNELTPHLLKKLPPTDSRLRPDQRHLENGEYETANAEKLRLEQLQRQVTKNIFDFLWPINHVCCVFNCFVYIWNFTFCHVGMTIDNFVVCSSHI